MKDSPKSSNLHTVTFYNTENLFDIYDDKNTRDNDLLPASYKKWTAKRYQDKIRKLGYAIAKIGENETNAHPAIVGLAEVENAKVLKDLVESDCLSNCNYNYIHYDSPDERGIDVALLYDKNIFELENTETFFVELFNAAGEPDYTRDVLLVTGLLNGAKIYIIVNHWSSRREGENETEYKRLAASNKVGEIISNIHLKDENAKIIVMGDFNDNPSSNSIKNLVEGFQLYNPMETLRSFSRGSLNHNRQWHLFDQILFSTNFFETKKNTLKYDQANIFDADFLKINHGKFKGTPYRTYSGKHYTGGYSDHFPVYVVLEKE